jgi:hypothetical protein
MPDFSHGAAYVDGQLVPIAEAKISLLDWGFLHSDATYDVAHVYSSQPRRLALDPGRLRADDWVTRGLCRNDLHARVSKAGITRPADLHKSGFRLRNSVCPDRSLSGRLPFP